MRVSGVVGVVEYEAIADLDALKARFVAAGVWVRPFRTIAYLTPALTIPDEDLTRLIDVVGDVSAAHGRGE